MTRAASRETRKRALRHDVVLQVPVLLGGLQQRLGDRQAGVVDHQVDARRRRAPRRGTPRRRPRRRSRRRRRRWPRRRRRSPRRRRPPSARSRSATTTQAPSAASRSAIALPMPLAAPVTSATRVASGFGFGIRGELGLLQRPVLDAELLALVDRRVGGDRLGAAHHVDGVDVELAGHPGGLLVRAEAEHARRPGTSTIAGSAPRIGGLSGVGVPVVVGRVVGAVLRVQLLQPRDDVLDRARAAAGPRPAAAPWCAGSGPGRTCPARPAAGARSRARKSSTTSASVK